MHARGHGIVVVLVVLAAAAPTAPATATAPPYHPSRLTHVGDARQVVVVSTRSWRSTYATVRAYRKDADGWTLRFGPWRGRVGYAGLARAAERRQNTGTTPAGTFGLLWAFGSRPDPGTGLGRYVRTDGNDWWPYDPKDPQTYNVFQRLRSPTATWRRGEAERLAHWGRGAYRYAVVLDYNLPSGEHWSSRLRERVADEPADTRRGGAIFLHVNGRGATAGCVSLPLRKMRRMLRWLDSDRDPAIVIGPVQHLAEM